MASKVTVRDKGYLLLFLSLRALSKWTGVVDVKQSKYRTGVQVRQVMEWHLKGTKTMPKRDFLTYWYTNGGEKKLLKAERLAGLQLIKRDNRIAKRTLETAGKVAVKDVRTSFNRMRWLAPSTVRRKKSARILYETGRLHDSLFFKTTSSS